MQRKSYYFHFLFSQPSFCIYSKLCRFYHKKTFTLP